MSLSAADLQKKHALEGAPDPFPSLPGGKDPKPTVANGKHSKKPQQAPIDTSSESAFPSLGGPASGKKPQTPSAWSTGGARERVARPERVSRPAVQSYIVSDTIELDKIDLKAAGKGGKPTTLGEVMRNVMAESGATIEASTARMTGKTTFIIKGNDDYIVETAKKLLISGLAPVVSKKLDAPASTIGMIIGPKGATLKGIREATNVRVDIPPRNASLAPPADGSAQVSRSPSPHAANDGADDEEATIPITVSGPAPLVDSAISMIQDIIDVKTSKITQRVKEIPAHVFPFLLPKIEELTAKAYQENPYKILNVDPRQQSNEIVCSGDRVVVAPTVEALKEAKQELEENLQSITLSMSRAQFPYILEPVFANELLTKFGAVAVPLEDDQAGLMIYGREGLGEALSRILAKSQERHSHSWPVRGHDLDKSLAILEYLVRSGIVKDIEAQDASLAIHTPTVAESRKRGQVNLELIGDRAPVKTAVGQLEKRAAAISDGLKGIEVDPIVLKVLKNKHGKALEKLQTDKNVIVSYPSEDSHSSTLIILHNHNGRDTDSVSKVRRCNEAVQSVQTLIKTVSDIKSETVTVDRKWHSAITGKQGATLESIIGEDKILSIEFGSRGKELKENEILVRGPADEVQRAVKQIHQVVADAEQYEIDHSHVIEFTIPQDYVGRVVGSQGSTINKIRESLDVKIDFNDESPEGAEWNEKGRGKKAVSKSKVRIQGTKESAEEAKKRILAQVEKLADETEEKLTIARTYHSGLIGAGGKYVSRMEDTHGVKIFFPRDGGSGGARELRENEVLVKGGRKGVAAAKAELLELVEFEKATNLVVKFDVPTKAISRILGKGGVSINEIKTNTGASIDVEKEESSPGKSSITVRGSSDQTKDAKAAILAIASEVGDEVTEILYIEPQYHRNFIGKGGETLRQLIISAGGPEDPKLQAGLVHFPRAGEPSDEVRLRGDKKVVAKLKKELEKLAAAQRDRIILGVGVPASLHRALIGRGGQHLNELQARTGTQVWFPGSRSYGGAGEPVNADQLGDVAFEDLVKVMGPKSGCEAAIAELQAKAAESSQQRERPSRISAGEQVTRSVYVPVKYHHVIVHQGGFQRSLRPHNVFVDFSQIPQEYVPPRPTSTAAAASARIDQDEAPADDGVDWQVAPNYEGAEEGEAEWTLRGRDEASLDTAEDLLKEAIKHAESLSHVGFLTLTDRSAFPRIVGAKGSNVSRIRAETGTEITVGKGDNTIVIIGSEAGLQDAKDAIMQTVEGGGRGRGRQD